MSKSQPNFVPRERQLDILDITGTPNTLILTGYYLESKEIGTRAYGKRDYHIFRTVHGEIVKVWSCMDLKLKLVGLPSTTLIRLTYLDQDPDTNEHEVLLEEDQPEEQN